jgi:hypothetical protein
MCSHLKLRACLWFTTAVRDARRRHPSWTGGHRGLGATAVLDLIPPVSYHDEVALRSGAGRVRAQLTICTSIPPELRITRELIPAQASSGQSEE